MFSLIPFKKLAIVAMANSALSGSQFQLGVFDKDQFQCCRSQKDKELAPQNVLVNNIEKPSDSTKIEKSFSESASVSAKEVHTNYLEIFDANISGVYTLSQDGHANWARIKSGGNFNPLEFLIYGSQAQGIASAQQNSNIVIRTTGSSFSAAWKQHPFFYFNGARYLVKEVAEDGNSLRVSTPSGEDVKFSENIHSGTYHYVVTTGAGNCIIDSNGHVSLKSGQPFVKYIKTLWIGITEYRVKSVLNDSELQLFDRPADYGYKSCEYFLNIFDEIATLRIQKSFGENEENLSIQARAIGSYWISSQISGSGSYYPIFISSGARQNGDLRGQLVVHPNGDTLIGGNYGQDVLRVIGPPGATIGRWIMEGAVNPGRSPALQARGAQKDVSAAYDAQGAGDHIFSSHSFHNTQFRVLGSELSQYYPTAGSSDDAGTVSAGGGDDAPVRLTGKGTAATLLGSNISPVKLPVFSVSSLPKCDKNFVDAVAVVKDAYKPIYGGPLNPNGSSRTLAFCDGRYWTAH